ncbi:MAG: glycine--tRNA ligase subunit beta [Acidobacteria bacterium]|nr:glycine--tRNA ligase subunit beta [Acidobacteriota bacterium]
MDRELLLEIGCEELPAGWLPGLTRQIGEAMVAALTGHRLAPASPAETFSTPRRLTVRIARVPERQTDLEELVTGPPVSAAFKPDGTPAPAAAGFAGRHGVEVGALERVRTSKGEYLAYRRRERGRTTVDVLPAVLGGALRAIVFPRPMRWDARLDDGKGELPFGRPIRWLLYLYGGRVVPFTIARSPGALSGQVQDVTSGAVTYGHRFLTTSGRAGRSIKVRSFDEYRARLLEHFVILERSGRHDKIARELDAKARRLQGRVSQSVRAESDLLQEVPDLVEYPSVVGGTFGVEFLDLPSEVLTTTLIHHQHYFPVESDTGRLKNAFLAVINTEPDNERTIARNAERVVTARLRDARFFWEADRRVRLSSRIERLDTLVFHRKLGTYAQKARRLEHLAGWIAREALGASGEAAGQAALAGRLAKTDLTTDMVRELTELQGTMGGIYAREEGLPEPVWKAIAYQYLPAGVEADAPPSRAQLGGAALTWASVALADKLDTIVGLFAAGEKPTGSRDPYGLRRAAQGVVKVLADASALGLGNDPIDLSRLVAEACAPFADRLPGGTEAWTGLQLEEFFWERQVHLLERRGYRHDEIRVVAGLPWARRHPLGALLRADATAKARHSQEFQDLAALFKRVKNITKDVEDRGVPLAALASVLKEPAEAGLLTGMIDRWPEIDRALAAGRLVEAMQRLAQFHGAVDRFFTDVLVMAEDRTLREARLALLTRLRRAILENFGDISEIAADARPV